MTEAGIVGTLKRLCEWSGHGGSSGGRASATFISSNTGVVGRSPGRHSGSGGFGGGPGSWGGSGSMRHMHGSSGHSTIGIDEDRSVVQRARVALDWLEHGEGYV